MLDEYLTTIRTLTVDCNFGETLVEPLLEQCVNGCAEKRIQMELLAMDDLHSWTRLCNHASHDTARKEGNARNRKVAHIHKVSRKPECGKPQHVAEAAQETKEPDLAMAETLQGMMEPDLTMAEEILDTMEPDLLATHEASTSEIPTAVYVEFLGERK